MNEVKDNLIVMHLSLDEGLEMKWYQKPANATHWVEEDIRDETLEFDLNDRVGFYLDTYGQEVFDIRGMVVFNLARTGERRTPFIEDGLNPRLSWRFKESSSGHDDYKHPNAIQKFILESVYTGNPPTSTAALPLDGTFTKTVLVGGRLEGDAPTKIRVFSHDPTWKVGTGVPWQKK